MKSFKFLLNALLCLPLLILLAGCATQEAEPAEPGVEDLAPGEKTVITAPSRQSGNQSGVAERNI